MYIENKTQEQKILDLLSNANWKWVALPKIIRLWIAQYNARIYWLRMKWYEIENKIKVVKVWDENKKHTFFRLLINKNEKQA